MLICAQIFNIRALREEKDVLLFRLNLIRLRIYFGLFFFLLSTIFGLQQAMFIITTGLDLDLASFDVCVINGADL